MILKTCIELHLKEKLLQLKLQLQRALQKYFLHVNSQLFTVVYGPVARMSCYTEILQKQIQCMIFVPQDSQHNILKIHPGHKNCISGDHRTTTTSVLVLDLKTHKVKCLGKTPIKIPALENKICHSFQILNLPTDMVRIFTGF